MTERYNGAPDCVSRAMEGVRELLPYAPGKPIAELEREYGVSNIIKMASNESPLGPSPAALEAARGALEELAMYPDGNAFALKHALAEHHDVAPECITLGNGSNDVLELAARVFLGAGRNAVFSRHAFAVYPLVTRAVGAESREAPVFPLGHAQAWGHDADAMAACIDDQTGVVFIANPNNPTGTWLSADALHALLDRIPRRTLAVLDEAYFEYVHESGYPDGSRLLEQYPNLLVTRTFSKAHGLAALRVGYGLSHPAVADLLNRVRQPFNVNSVAQAAALASLNDHEHIRHAVAINDEGLECLAEGFERLGLEWIPSVANFVCVRVPDAPAVYQALLREGIIVRPVETYGLPGFLRVSVGRPSDNKRFLETLQKVLAT